MLIAHSIYNMAQNLAFNKREMTRINSLTILSYLSVFFLAFFLIATIATTGRSRILTYSRNSQTIELQGAKHTVTPNLANELKSVQKHIRRIKINDDSLFISAYDPGLYVIFSQKNPIYISQFNPSQTTSENQKRVMDQIDKNST